MPDIRQSYLFVLPWTLERAGGVNQVVANLYAEFESQGDFTPLLLINNWEASTIRECPSETRQAYSLNMRSPWDGMNLLRNLVAFLIELPAKLKDLKAFAVAHNVVAINVHYFGSYSIYFALLKITKMFKGKLILSFHGADLKAANQAPLLERVANWVVLHSCDQVVACSRSLEQEVVKHFPFLKSKTVAILNGVETVPQQKPGAAVTQLKMPEKYILTVGTYEGKKGQDVLIQAFSLITNDYPEFSLIIVGRAAGFEVRLRELVTEMRLCDRVVLAGELQHDEVYTLLVNATLFALPSRIEPFGIVLLEAGLYAVPVIASNVGGIPEIITHGQNGLLVEPDDPGQLAHAIRDLLIDPDKRKLLGENLCNHVLNNFSWKRAYAQYVDLI